MPNTANTQNTQNTQIGEVTYNAELHILCARDEGLISFHAVRRRRTALLALAQQHRCPRLLLDHTGVTGKDVYMVEAVQEQHEYNRTGIARLALAFLINPYSELQENYQNFVTICRNYGMLAQVFTDKTEAVAWLQAYQGGTPMPEISTTKISTTKTLTTKTLTEAAAISTILPPQQITTTTVMRSKCAYDAALHTVIVRDEGIYDIYEARQRRAEWTQLLQQHQCRRVLLDNRLITGRTCSLAELYFLPSEYAQSPTITQSAAAIWITENHPMQEDYQYFAQTCRNHSFRVDLFTDYAEAIAWLQRMVP